jgi:uncharacterized protein YndB with AHSA1/START domain
LPTAQRTRRIAASQQELWEVLGDPHHLPRWWPRVNRVEAVDGDAFTEVLMGPSGKVVRADFKLLESVSPRRIVWSQQVQGTPFERVLKSAETEVLLADAGGGRAGDGGAGEDRADGREADGGKAGGKTGGKAGGKAGGSEAEGGNARGGEAWVGDGPATDVTIELRQELQGFRGSGALSLRLSGISRFGSPLVRRAALSTVEEALDGLERIVGRRS